MFIWVATVTSLEELFGDRHILYSAQSSFCEVGVCATKQNGERNRV